MSEAGRPAACPEDGSAAERVFTAPGLLRGAPEAPAPPAAPGRRYWSSPFFPKAPTPARELAPAPRHVLPPGSSKPTSFRHFGHWHPAGTAPHTHGAPRAPRPKGKPGRS
jgi:hypothetical protein